MKFPNRHRGRTVGVIALALLAFLAGTSFACLQKAASAKMAEDCCKGHCRHVMAADMAAKCCRSHEVKVSQALPTASSTQAASLVAHTASVSLILPVVLRDPGGSRTRRSAEERPPPVSPLYARHCTFLI